MDTVTVSDYSAEFMIKPKMYLTFKQEYEEKIRKGEIPGQTLTNYSLITEFKTALINAIEEQIIALQPLYKQLDRVVICNIYFCFNNKEIIDLLKDRGYALRYGQIMKAREIDEQLKSVKERLMEQERIP